MTAVKNESFVGCLSQGDFGQSYRMFLYVHVSVCMVWICLYDNQKGTSVSSKTTIKNKKF